MNNALSKEQSPFSKIYPLEQRTTLPILLHLCTPYRLLAPGEQRSDTISGLNLAPGFQSQEIADSLYGWGIAAESSDWSVMVFQTGYSPKTPDFNMPEWRYLRRKKVVCIPCMKGQCSSHVDLR